MSKLDETYNPNNPKFNKSQTQQTLRYSKIKLFKQR